MAFVLRIADCKPQHCARTQGIPWRTDGRANRTTKNEAHVGSDRGDGQRNGVDRAGRLSLDYLRSPGWICVSIGPGDVGGDIFCGRAGLRHRDLILRVGQTLSGRGELLPVRGKGVPEHYARLPIRPHREIRHRMGLASLLLGLSRRDGRDHRHHDRIHRRQHRAQLYECGNSGAGVHGGNRDHFRIRHLMDRVSRGRRLDQRQSRDQHRCSGSRCCSSPRWRFPTA